MSAIVLQADEILIIFLHVNKVAETIREKLSEPFWGMQQ
jgi:hypothetical protein